MKALARLETILQDVLERPQWLLAPRRLHPLELAAAIVREMERNVIPLGDRIVAPNRFTIRVNRTDLDGISPMRRTLERELAMFAQRAAEERGLSLPATPLATFEIDAGRRAGDVEVEAAFEEAQPARATTARPRPPAAMPFEPGFTERINRAPVAPATGVATPAMTAVEVLDERGAAIRNVPLDGAIVTIGRRSGNDIALPDLEVSRQHARIDFIPPRFYVTDLGSTNGTRVNGHRVAGRHPLSDGDLIELGNSRLRFIQRG